MTEKYNEVKNFSYMEWIIFANPEPKHLLNLSINQKHPYIPMIPVININISKNLE